MAKSVPYMSEIVSLTVMFLMALALVTGQADATIHNQASATTDFAVADVVEEVSTPFRSTINARIHGDPLTISIHAVTELNNFRFEDE